MAHIDFIRKMFFEKGTGTQATFKKIKLDEIYQVNTSGILLAGTLTCIALLQSCLS